MLAETCPPEARILDLACGPGSLGTRLRGRFPRAQVVGLDFDPVLLALAGAAHAGDERRSWVEADLRDRNWWTRADLGRFDAVVSTTALHWLAGDELTRVYRDLATLLRPGGVLVNGDHVAPDAGEHTLARIAAARRQEAHREADALGRTTWDQWWDAIAADPVLVEEWRERGRRFGVRHGEEPITLGVHLAALRQGGFVQAGVAWQRWDDVVIVGTTADAPAVAAGA